MSTTIRVIVLASAAFPCLFQAPTSGQSSEKRLAGLPVSVQVGRLEGPEDEILGLVGDGVLTMDAFGMPPNS